MSRLPASMILTMPMPMPMRAIGSAAMLLAVSTFSLLPGCGGSDAIQEASLEVRIAAVEVEVNARIGPALCVSDDDCRVLPMGANACGGPAKFLPYSVRGTDEAALTHLASDHQRLSAQLQAQQQTLAPCVMLAQPVPFCSRSAPLSCRLR